MKKIFLFLAIAAFTASCNNLGENQYRITGRIDKSADGRKVFLEKPGGYLGGIPLDTAVVKDGKFVFEGTATEPALRFISIEGQIAGKAEFILESGKIELDVVKDTLYNSKQGGTYNNEKLYEYYKSINGIRKKMLNFQNANKDAMMKAYQAKDTVVMAKLNKEYSAIGKEMSDNAEKFVKANPKAYISVLLVKQMFLTGMPLDKIQGYYNSLEPSLKKTEEGKELAKKLAEATSGKTAKEGVEVGMAAPVFSAKSPEGKTMSLKSAMGKVTVIDFWASWCKPCRQENPNMVALYNEFHKDGLNIISVSLDKDAAAWKKAIADDKLNWNHVSNLKYWDEPIAKQYGVESIPATFVLDETGKVAGKDLRGAELHTKVKLMLEVLKNKK